MSFPFSILFLLAHIAAAFSNDSAPLLKTLKRKALKYEIGFDSQ